MRGVNKSIMVGNLCADPETGYTAGDEPKQVAKARLAVNTKRRDREHTLFINLVFFGPLAEIFSKFNKKGDCVYIEGRLNISDWLDKEETKRQSVEVVVDQLVMLGSPGEKAA